ncbi:hypothetical protein [Thiolapillus sp.]|uniref:hypothetical protein n=1 Tax=Thiolapillus sp. TaxID=2017437 RepID=UPI0025E7D994|nr:hypothetical protein [Thiolapillus sp.]
METRRKFAIMHIPKCAGTALGELISMGYGAGTIERVTADQPPLTAYKAPVVIGHCAVA